jgi:two-component system, chemotaxis family, chemotaxis protein CheY
VSAARRHDGLARSTAVLPICDGHRATVARKNCAVPRNLTVLLLPIPAFPAFRPTPELTRCSMSPVSCHGADGCGFEKRQSGIFSRATHIHLCSAACCLRGVWDMAFDLSMPILVVDDYSTMIRIIRNLLKQIGFENVDEASDGSAALAKMQTKRYGLVISDWNMEPMTGYDLLKEVRASPEFSKTPFIMITAESKTENVIAAKKAGVNNYIVKPFNAATLKTKMEAVFPG